MEQIQREQNVITVIGGSGFLGRFVVRRLAQAGYRLRLIERDPESAKARRTAGLVGQIAIVPGDITRPETLQLERSYAVINLAGILHESGRQRFEAVHVKGPAALAKQAAQDGVQRFIHISALGVDKAANSAYARSKTEGESQVRQAFPRATILRPGIMFGPDDAFFNRFARLAMFAPALPLIGGGTSRFQPVYVGDVAQAIEAALSLPEAPGKTYELAGPSLYMFRELMESVLRWSGHTAKLIPLPFGLAKILAAFTGLLPNPPLTRDQVRLLAYDNIAGGTLPGLSALGIAPTPVELIVPEDLGRFRKDWRAAS